MPDPTNHRRGAALTIALVILVALLLLGIPFLVLQSSGLGGFKAFAQQAEARRGLATAEAMGMALATYVGGVDAYGSSSLWKVEGTSQYSQLSASLGTYIDPRFADGLGFQIIAGSAITAEHDIGATGPPGAQAELAAIGGDGQSVETQRDPSLLRSRLNIALEAWRIYERRDQFAGSASSDHDAARLGLTIEDESGKLDPNFMSAAQWDALLKAVLPRWQGKVTGKVWQPGPGGAAGSYVDQDITGWFDADWDDDEIFAYAGPTGSTLASEPNRVFIWDSEDRTPPSRDRFGILQDDTAPNPPAVATAFNDDGDDTDRLGQLAQALADLGGSITDLEQLLTANPGHKLPTDPYYNKDDTLGFVYSEGPLSPIPSGHSFGFRKPLTRAELSMLKPYLTLHQTPQGRDCGVTDLGTVVRRSDDGTADRDTVWVDAPFGDTAPDGVRLQLVRAANVTPPTNTSTTYLRGSDQTTENVRTRLEVSRYLMAGDSLLLRLPPAINVNAAPQSVLTALAASLPRRTDPGPPEMRQRTIPVMPLPASIATIAALSDWRPGMANTQLLGGPDSTQDPSSNLLFPGTSGLDLLRPWGWKDSVETITVPWDPENTIRCETSPIGIRGWGVYRLSATSMVANRADPNAPVTQVSSTTIVQAIPQEQVLEQRWTSQADMHALVLQRHASLCTTGPAALERVRWDGDAEVPNVTADQPGWIQSRPMPNLATGYLDRLLINQGTGQFDVTWRWDLGLAQPRTLAATTADWMVQPADLSARQDVLNRLTPDGWSGTVQFKADRILPIGSNALPAVNVPGFHLSCWYKAPAGAIGLQTIVDLDPSSQMTPIRNLGDGFSDDDKTTYNRISVLYDPDKQLIGLIIAPPGAPATGAPFTIAPTAQNDTSNPSRAGGMAGVDVSMVTPTTAVQAVLGSMWQPNRTVLFYKVPGGLGDGWHHIQCIVSQPRPGGLTVLVDGIAGRDAVANGLTSLVTFGDHVLLPQVLLETHLEQTDTIVLPLYGSTHQTYGTHLAEIRTSTVLGFGPDALFPPRGMIRIGSEWLAYSARSSTGFQQVRRGCRRTYTSGSVVLPDSMPKHESTTPVIGGGVGTNLDSLWRGGARLSAQLPASALVGTLPGFGTWPTGRPNVSNAADWPDSGLVHITGAGVDAYYLYANGATPELVTNNWFNNNWQGNGAATAAFLAPSQLITQNGQTATWCGFPLTSIDSADLTDPSLRRFPLTPGSTPVGNLLQIMDANGSVEWIGYDTIIKNPATQQYFVLSWNGFASRRGLLRTTARICLAENSQVIPVQFSANAYLLTTGDQITVAPQSYAAPGISTDDGSPPRPTHLLVRYRPDPDMSMFIIGLPPSAATWVRNDLFAFASPLPWRVDSGTTVRAVVGSGLGATGATPGDDAVAMPRLDLAGGGASTAAAVTWGSTGATLDGLAIGKAGSAGMLTTRITGFSVLNGGAWDSPNATGLNTWDPTNGPILATVTQALPGFMGLIRIDGEVFAWRRPFTGVLDQPGGIAEPPTPNEQVVLFRRGLLGSAVAAHTMPDDKLTAQILPVGPVAMVAHDERTPGSGWFQLTRVSGTTGLNGRSVATPISDFDAPAALVIAANGSSQSVVQLVGPRSWRKLYQRTTANITTTLLDDTPVASPNPGRLVGQTTITIPSGTLLPIEAGESIALVGSATIRKADGTTVGAAMSITLTTSFTPANPGVTDDAWITMGEYTTAPWLTGLYGTPEPSWRYATGPNDPDRRSLKPGDLVIGWWPRYPSPLPGADGTDPDPMPQAYRSRTKSWVGYPLRLRGAVFDPAAIKARWPGDPSNSAVAQVNLLDAGNLEVQARAMARGIDWSQRPAADVPIGGIKLGTDRSLTDIFGSPVDRTVTAPVLLPQFVSTVDNQNVGTMQQSESTDGAELRLTFHLPSTATTSPSLVDIADRGGRTPRIGAVRLRCLAPTMVLGTETER